MDRKGAKKKKWKNWGSIRVIWSGCCKFFKGVWIKKYFNLFWENLILRLTIGRHKSAKSSN